MSKEHFYLEAERRGYIKLLDEERDILLRRTAHTGLIAKLRSIIGV